MCISLLYPSTNVNNFIANCGKAASIFDDGVFRFLQHGAGLGQHISLATGNIGNANKCESLSNASGNTRSAIGAVRFVASVHDLATNPTFREKGPDGFRKVAYENGQPLVIPRNELGAIWTKQDAGHWQHALTGEVSHDGKYIEDAAAGQYVRKGWMDIAMQVLAFAARIISPIRWLHTLGAYNLGQHAKNLGGAVMGIWATVLSLNLIQSIKGLVEEVDVSAIRRKIADLVVAFFDLVSLPFDFGVGASHPGLAITGAVLNIVSAGAFLFHEAVYYN